MPYARADLPISAHLWFGPVFGKGMSYCHKSYKSLLDKNSQAKLVLVGDTATGKLHLLDNLGYYPRTDFYNATDTVVEVDLDKDGAPEDIPDPTLVQERRLADLSSIVLHLSILSAVHPTGTSLNSSWTESRIKNADIVGLCFHVCSRKSLEHAIHKWFPLIRHHLPFTPVVLIGCQSHRRNDEDFEGVSVEEVERAAGAIGAIYLVEWSLEDDGRSIAIVRQVLAWHAYHEVRRRRGRSHLIGCVVL